MADTRRDQRTRLGFGADATDGPENTAYAASLGLMELSFGLLFTTRETAFPLHPAKTHLIMGLRGKPYIHKRPGEYPGRL